MAVRVSHTNNSSGHDGTYVYRSTSPIDPQNLPAPIADEAPVALGETFEYIDSPPDGTHYYRTQDHEGGQVSTVSAEVSIVIGDDYASAQVGDEIGGGIYAGTDTIGGVDYHIISGKAESEEYGLKWKTSFSITPGTGSATDGLANTLAMEAAGLAEHPAAAYCLAYEGGGFTDWHMPANSQLTLLYNNLAGHPEFANNTSGYTWSSTEDSASGAWAMSFSGGNLSLVAKDSTNRRLRPIRRVAV